MVTLLGLVLYGFLRLIYDLFYGPLGVKPEEVGLGYAETLSQSLVGILLYFIGMFLVIVPLALVLLLTILIWVTLIATIISDVRRDRRFLISLLLGAAFVVILTRLPEKVLQVFLIASAGIVVLGAVGWAVRLVLLRVHRRSGKVTHGESRSNQPVAPAAKPPVRAGSWWPRVQAWWRRLGFRAGQRWRRSMTITAVLTTVLTTALVVIVLIVAARLGAASVQQGEAARRPSFLGVALTSWRAEPATVTWSGGTPPGGLNLSDDRCLLYLGQSNGITVLYDATAHRNIRLPSSDVIISVRNEETVCPSRE